MCVYNNTEIYVQNLRQSKHQNIVKYYGWQKEMKTKKKKKKKKRKKNKNDIKHVT